VRWWRAGGRIPRRGIAGAGEDERARVISRRPDILCISSIDWDFIWQGHQEIMSRLAADGHRVLFIENTGVRSPRLRDLPRLRQRMRNWWKGTKGFRTERANLVVFSPIVLPLPYSRVARWVNRWLLQRGIQRWMRATGFNRPIVWTFLPTPLTRDIINEVDPAITIYYCIDDLASSSHEARKITTSEQRLFRDADLVFVTSQKLKERAQQYSDRVHLFPFGVSLATFEKVRRESPQPPADIASLPRPIVGYVGGLHQWLDQPLIADLARRMSDVTFVLVGPAQVDVASLAEHANIHLLGKREHHELPRYIAAFDVGLVPYRLTEYTANVYPTKLNEYLAMGIPVVATDLAEIRRFNVEHGNLVHVAADAAAFERAIRTALSESSADAIPKRIAAAHENSWERRVEQMMTLVESALDKSESGASRWEERLRRLYRTASRRGLQLAAGAVILYLLLFQTTLLWWLAEPLKIDQPPQAVDAVVVFAGGVGESGRAGGGFQERVREAVDLYHAGYARHLIFSSGFVSAFKEAEVMRAVALDNGVPSEALLLEEEAVNTYENVVRTAAILERNGWQRILLVSSPYHMRRALLTWKRNAPGVTVIASPPPESQFYAHTRGATLEQIRGILQEYVAILDYWRKGWI
jgi:uncharacterized SAM-binding protein YcdF (DUF218 family)/glycosyltransferase involved in cell wall biosynthesis